MELFFAMQKELPTTADNNLPPPRYRLNTTCVIRPRGRALYSTLGEALDEIRAWVGFGEAERIFEKTFGL
jgi:hypothetical protein